MWRIAKELAEFNRLVRVTGIIPEHKDGDEDDCGIPTRSYILRSIKELTELEELLVYELSMP